MARSFALALLTLLAGGPAVPPARAEAPAPVAPDPRLRAILEAGAADLEVDVRRRAVAALVRLDPAPGGGAWGRRGRFDPDAFVQRAAADALAERGSEPESRVLLRELATAPAVEPLTRGHAALLLVRLEPATAVEVDAWARAEPGWGAVGLHLAAAAGGVEGAADRLAAALAQGELPLDLGFLRDLVAAAPASAATGLEAGLPRLEPELRPAAQVVLWALSGQHAGPIRAGLRGGDEELALELLERVDELDDARALPMLRAARGGLPAVRRAALLRRVGRGDAPPGAALAALSGTDPELRVLAARALGAWRERVDPGNARVREALHAAARSEDPGVQLAALGALARRPDPEDRALLQALLDDESLRVRVIAAEGLLGR